MTGAIKMADDEERDGGDDYISDKRGSGRESGEVNGSKGEDEKEGESKEKFAYAGEKAEKKGVSAGFCELGASKETAREGAREKKSGGARRAKIDEKDKNGEKSEEAGEDEGKNPGGEV